MCKRNEESIDHLLLHCPIANELWAMIYSLFGVQWVMPKSVMDVMSCWEGRFGLHRSIQGWKAIPNCIMWNLFFDK